MLSQKSYKSTIACVYSFQFVLIVLFAIFCKYDESADVLKNANSTRDITVQKTYPLFQDVHVMIFIGFGMLMTFLKRYGYSGVGFTFLISSLIIQWGIFCYGLFRLDADDGKYSVNVLSLMTGDIIAAAVMISFGAVLGKTSPLQLIIMGTIETVLFVANEYLGSEILEVADAGGSIYVHAFGAYFGLAVSFTLNSGVVSTTGNNKLEGSSYQSDLSSIIGTIFLWAFWPSFNAGLLDSNDRHRSIINTYLALASCCATAFATSSLCTKSKKFDMVHIQNATLAGGVCIGTSANMLVQPYGAILIGSFAGILSTLGFEHVQGWLLKKFHIHDTCGVNNLHGMPAIAAGLISALLAGLATEDDYGESLSEVFPAMNPKTGRSGSKQAGYQLIGLIITLVVSVIGGLFTGLSIRSVGKVNDHYDDAIFWILPDENPEEIEGNANRLPPSNDIVMSVNKD